MSNPCGCPEEKRPSLGDDDRFKKWVFPSLIEAQTPIDFTITIKVTAIGSAMLIENILDEFDRVKHGPNSDQAIRMLVEELDEINETLSILKDSTRDTVNELDWDDLLGPIDFATLDIDIDIDVN